MNILPNHGLPSNPNRRDLSGSGEDTLRLIANLPAPDGLADRVKAGLASAPEAGRILMWRGPLRPPSGWMYTTLARGAAAAAIVGIVAGGGWRIYSHVQPASSANMIVMPARTGQQSGGFSSAGAKRVPETLQGPVLKHPTTPEVDVVQKSQAQPKAVPGQPVARKKKKAASPVIPPQ